MRLCLSRLSNIHDSTSLRDQRRCRPTVRKFGPSPLAKRASKVRRDTAKTRATSFASRSGSTASPCIQLDAKRRSAIFFQPSKTADRKCQLFAIGSCRIDCWVGFRSTPRSTPNGSRWQAMTPLIWLLLMGQARTIDGQFLIDNATRQFSLRHCNCGPRNSSKRALKATRVGGTQPHRNFARRR